MCLFFLTVPMRNLLHSCLYEDPLVLVQDTSELFRHMSRTRMSQGSPWQSFLRERGYYITFPLWSTFGENVCFSNVEGPKKTASLALPLLAVQAGLGETCVFFLDGRIRQL